MHRHPAGPIADRQDKQTDTRWEEKKDNTRRRGLEERREEGSEFAYLFEGTSYDTANEVGVLKLREGGGQVDEVSEWIFVENQGTARLLLVPVRDVCRYPQEHSKPQLRCREGKRGRERKKETEGKRDKARKQDSFCSLVRMKDEL